MSATIDHIIPLIRGGSPDDMDNLQLAHFCCNRAKSDKVAVESIAGTTKPPPPNNRDLPLSMDWTIYKSAH